MPQDVEVQAQIIPKNGANFPVAEAFHIKGGRQSVATLAERDAILPNRREEGMQVYVVNNQTTYELQGGTENTHWQPLPKAPQLTFKPSETEVLAIAEPDLGDYGFALDNSALYLFDGAVWHPVSNIASLLPDLIPLIMSITASQLPKVNSAGLTTMGTQINATNPLAVENFNTYGTAPDEWAALIYSPQKTEPIAPEKADPDAATFTINGTPIPLLIMEAEVMGLGPLVARQFEIDFSNVSEANYGRFFRDFKARMRLINMGDEALTIGNTDLSTGLDSAQQDVNNDSIDLPSGNNYVGANQASQYGRLHCWFKLESAQLTLSKNDWLDFQIAYDPDIEDDASNPIGGFVARQMDAAVYQA